MDHGSEQHDEHGGIHLPDPSVWPLVVGLSALILGIALVWWSRTTDDSVSGPILGAATVVTLFAAAGWAYEDGRMRKKAEEGDHKKKAPRYTQVMTFAIPAGKGDQAHGGVLAALNAADGTVHKLPGFVDLRITVSPASSGPLQTIVETTWADKDEQSSYATAKTELEGILAAHSDEVVAGSLRSFDMEVIRDTKEQAMKMGMGATVGLVLAFVVGGFIVGGALTLFQHKGEVVAAEQEVVDPNAPPVMTATDNKFTPTSLTAPANSPYTILFRNNGKTKHNLHFYTAAGGQTLADGAEGAIIDGRETETMTFTTPAAGTYYFQCDLHVTEMNGTFTVQ